MKQTNMPAHSTPMQDAIITIFVLCDELLTALNHHEDTQVKMSDAE